MQSLNRRPVPVCRAADSRKERGNSALNWSPDLRFSVQFIKLAMQLIEGKVRRPIPRPEEPQHLCLDKGYDYDEVRDLGKEFGYTYS